MPSSNSNPNRAKYPELYEEEPHQEKPRRRRRKKNKRNRNRNKYKNDYILTPQSNYDYDYDYGDRFSQDFELDGERRRPLSATLGYDPDGMAYIRYINKRKLDTNPSKLYSE